jgi:hypothetical protein
MKMMRPAQSDRAYGDKKEQRKEFRGESMGSVGSEAGD